MPNGTGKTTTLQMLRAALSGEASTWSPAEIRKLQKKPVRHSTGRFLVDGILDGAKLTLELTLDFDEGTASYTTTYRAGNRLGFHAPQQIRAFLNPDFVRLFVFDGEQAHNLLDINHTNAERAIESLFQLRFFEQMRKYVQEYWTDRAQTTTATEERGYSRRTNRLNTLRDRLRACRLERKVAGTERDLAKAEVDRLTAEHADQIRSNDGFSSRLKIAEDQLTSARNEVVRQTALVQSAVKDPFALSGAIASEMVDLRASLDRVKLPESAAREFFDELAQELLCVCGRPLDDETRNYIRSQAPQYLGTDEVALLNAMKSSIAAIANQPSGPSEALRTLFDELSAALRSESEARTELEAVEADAGQKYPEIDAIKDRLARAEQHLETMEAKLQKYETDDQGARDESTSSIRALERLIREAENRLAEVTETLELKGKRDIIDRLLQQAHSTAKANASVAIVNEANQAIQRLLPNNAIRIREIKGCLVLDQQEGGSAGETLSIAYAFLTTFFNSANHQFPFIVDSPAGAIDLEVRTRIADILPRIAGQVIAFTISSERSGFCDRFSNNGQSQAQYITLFRKGLGQVDIDARTVEGHQESSDGLLVPGREFFEEFQEVDE
jgi:DNA repair exonuclease SbcCD ATPase subunit